MRTLRGFALHLTPTEIKRAFNAGEIDLAEELGALKVFNADCVPMFVHPEWKLPMQSSKLKQLYKRKKQQLSRKDR